MQISIPGPQGSYRADFVLEQLSRGLASLPPADPSAGRLARLRGALAQRGYLLAHAGAGLSLGAMLHLWHILMMPSVGTAPPAERERLLERFFDTLIRDLQNARRGYYPEDLVFRFPFATYAKVAPELVIEGPRILLRKHRNDFTSLPDGAFRDRYPDYYRRTFHWQTDGWLSARSARLYDASVEVLFVGLGDVMRRMAIPHVADAVSASPAPRVLDLACGTGRFLWQMHRALPRTRLTGVDLSAPYIERAERLLAGTGTSFLVENAEAVPLEGASFDAVTSVFLFHELPRDARRNVAREAFRLVRPGGAFVICDSAQHSDASDVRFYLDTFPSLYHEPYHKGYLRDDLAEMLREVGFESVTTESWFLAKVVAGRKPGRAGAARAAA